MGRTASSSSSSAGGLFGCIPPRTATLAIAILGIIIHLNTYSWLGALSSTLPDVPERGSAVAGGIGAPVPAPAFVPSPDRFANSAAKGEQLIDLDLYKNTQEGSAEGKHVFLPEWVAEAKAYLKAQGLSFTPSGPDAGTTHKDHKPAEPASTNHYEATEGLEVLDDGAEDVERMQWDALRLVIGTLRWYILLSVVCCCAGVVGVLRSQLLLSRLFVIHSFLDFLLSTLSLFALAIVLTYPSVRAHLCDEFGNGELQSLFSTPPPSNSPPTTPPPSSTQGADGTAASGWETLLDGVFASENCEESFRTTLVPLLMVFGLFFTAVRLQCFFLVQRFYAGLLRSKVWQYGYVTGADEGGEEGGSTPMSQLPSGEQPVRERRWKESKLLD